MMMTTSTIKMQAYGITGDLMDKLLPLWPTPYNGAHKSDNVAQYLRLLVHGVVQSMQCY